MSSKQPATTLINVPTRFSVVEAGVYRSASPTAAEVPFLASLSLRTIVSLTCEHPTRVLLSYARASGVEFPCNLASAFGANALAQIHLGNTLFQPLTDWKPISDEIVKAALEIIVDVRSHPVLIVDPVGIHQTGVVLGCLRIMQGWNFASALSEYRSHSGPAKHRYADETYIELFDPDIINLPPRQYLPEWWDEEVSEDEDWVEADPPPKEKKKKDKKDKEGKEGKDKEGKEGKDKEKDKDKKDKDKDKGEDKDKKEKDNENEVGTGLSKPENGIDDTPAEISVNGDSTQR